jgi:hypothetical protein
VTKNWNKNALTPPTSHWRDRLAVKLHELAYRIELTGPERRAYLTKRVAEIERDIAKVEKLEKEEEQDG